MFKGFSLRFSDMKVGGKLAFGFGALVLLTILVGAVSYAAQEFQGTALAELQSEEDHSRLDANIRTELLEARRREKDFLLRWETEGYDQAYQAYIVVNQQHVSTIQTQVDESIAHAQVENNTDEADQLKQVKDAVSAYSTGLLGVTELLKTRGFKDTGLEGDFRVSAHDLEAQLGTEPDLVILLLQMRRKEKDYLLRGTQEDIDAAHDWNTQLRNAILANEDFTESQKTELVGLVDSYRAKFDQLVSTDSEVLTKTDEFRAQAQSIDPVVEQLLARDAEHVAAALASYQTAQSVARAAEFTLIGLAVLMGVVLAFAISRGITNQVREIEKLFRAAAIGDFNARASILTKDELGDTASGVNALLDQLVNLLRTAETERVALEQALDTLVTTASSADVAEQAAASAQAGTAAVEDAITAMQRIRTSTQEAGRITKRLGEASQEINEIVAIIEDLSDRTTVLALNASIQAAAAGDAGRGFSVVAEEVQRLAERATAETRRIENLVKTIQSETNSAVVSIDEATREVVTGTQLTQKAGEQMTLLNGLVNQVSGLISVAAESASEQTGQPVPTMAVPMGGNGHSNGQS